MMRVDVAVEQKVPPAGDGEIGLLARMVRAEDHWSAPWRIGPALA